MAFKYQECHLAWLTEYYPKLSRRNLTEQFNHHFELTLPMTSIIACVQNHGIKSGRDGRFLKNHIPHNDGVKGVRLSQATEFKKGNRPKNYLPVGSERVNGEGYHDIKIADPNKWKTKHVLLWEELNGKVPKGHCIIFVDGDKNHIDIDNLTKVSRSELAVLNKRRFSAEHNELKPALITLTKLECLTNKLARSD